MAHRMERLGPFMQAAAAFLEFDDDSDVDGNGERMCAGVSLVESEKQDKMAPVRSNSPRGTKDKKRTRAKHSLDEMESVLGRQSSPAVLLPSATTVINFPHPPETFDSKKLKSDLSDFEKWMAIKKQKLPKGKTTKGRGKRLWSSSDESSSTPTLSSQSESDGENEQNLDSLYGCPQCHYTWNGCSTCRKEDPMVQRPKIAWDPAHCHEQENIPSGPVYYPTAEEFANPFEYVARIRSEAEKYGICMIVPPSSWSSSVDPLSTDVEDYEFFPKRQLISSLCLRSGLQYEKRSEAEGMSPHSGEDEEFGFGTSEMPFTFHSFKAFAEWAQHLHFDGRSSNNAALSTKEIEGEFWRLVETGDEAEFETFYGSDLDASQFPEAFTQAPPLSDSYKANWSVCTWPRSVNSVLRFLPGTELINGVMIPWVYFGSSLSAFCWHIEDHALYSINYLHKGAAKIWYGVPSSHAADFESAMKDAFPKLFESDPRLLHRLVTHLSPKELTKRGVPVHRIEHKPGSFVITFPNGYHGGFNCGWNCAEAVNFAPPDWLPHGTDVVQKYRELKRQTTFSHDALLLQIALSLRSKTKQADPLAIQFAIGELNLRIEEEERRLVVAHATGIAQERRIEGGEDGKETAISGEEGDCVVCKCDLFLSSVTSENHPESAVCPEHAQHLPANRILHYRYTVAELWEIVKEGLEAFPGEAEKFVERAKARMRTSCVALIHKKGQFCGQYQ